MANTNPAANKAIFITVRTGSSRLPKKALLPILGKTTTEHLIDRVKLSEMADLVVLCTTELPEDDVLCEIAKRNGIQSFRGSTQDKLDRWRGAARKFNVEFFVTADGDDLFCDPKLIDLAFAQYERNHADFIQGKGMIPGAFTYGIKTSALEKVCEIKNTDDTEMMWVYFTDTGLFNVENLQGIDRMFLREDIRMTLDYDDDFTFFKNIIEALSPANKAFSLKDIVTYLDQYPEVIAINKHLDAIWRENQQKKTKLVLKS